MRGENFKWIGKGELKFKLSNFQILPNWRRFSLNLCELNQNRNGQTTKIL